MKVLLAAVAVWLIAAGMASCAIDDATAAVLLDTIDAAEESGGITALQAAAAREVLAGLVQGVTWSEVGAWIGGIGATIGGSILGVQKIRGPSRGMDREETDALRELAAKAKDILRSLG